MGCFLVVLGAGGCGTPPRPLPADALPKGDLTGTVRVGGQAWSLPMPVFLHCRSHLVYGGTATVAPDGTTKFAGRMPTTSNVDWPRAIVRPTIAGSPPKRCCHDACARTACST